MLRWCEHATPRLRAFDGETDRERFVRLLESRPDMRAQFLPGPVLDVRQAGGRASIRLGRSDPMDRSPTPEPTSGVCLAWYEGRWCLSYGAATPE